MPYLFLAGLGEKSFPSPQREDRLYSEAECQRLIEQGLPLATRAERNGEEMLLFYEAVTRATRRLWFSYPALDEAGAAAVAQPVLEGSRAGVRSGADRADGADRSEPGAGRRRAFLGRRVPRQGGGRGLGRRRVAAWPACCKRLRARSAADNILAGLAARPAATGPRAFRPGRRNAARAPCVRRQLAAEFSPQRVFSATELEQYAACPFRFFLAKLLRVRAGRGPGAGGRLPGARTAGARPDGGVPSPGEPGGAAAPPRRPRWRRRSTNACCDRSGRRGDRPRRRSTRCKTPCARSTAGC